MRALKVSRHEMEKASLTVIAKVYRSRSRHFRMVGNTEETAARRFTNQNLPMKKIYYSTIPMTYRYSYVCDAMDMP